MTLRHLQRRYPYGPFLVFHHSKSSSYKKLQKFLKTYEKRGFLKLKEVKSELLVMSITKQHKVYVRNINHLL